MSDPRIEKLRQAVESISNGRYDLDFPSEDPDDEIARLEQVLCDLAQALERKEREARALGQITEEINAGFRLDEILDDVYEVLRPLIPCDRLGFAVIEDDKQKRSLVRALWARSDLAEVRLEAGYSAPLEGSSLEEIVRTGRPRILNDLEEYLREHPDSDSTRRIVEEGVHSSLTCPLIGPGNKPVGFLFFSSRQPGAYRDVHVEFFLQIARQLSVIVEKGRLCQELDDLCEMRAQFLNIASHDLKAPLTTIKATAWLIDHQLSTGSAATEEVHKLIKRIHRQSEVMQQLIEDFLDFQALEDGQLQLQPEAINLSEIARHVVDHNAEYAGKKEIRLDFEPADGLPEVQADPARIEQVAQNLVSNALKFGPKESSTVVRTRHDETSVRLEVRDTGPGLSPEDHDKLFIRHARLSNRPTGGEKSFGLGLAICRDLIELHGGRIDAENNPDGGATFWFSLPLER